MIPLLSRPDIENARLSGDDRIKKMFGLLLAIMDYDAYEPFKSLQNAYQQLFEWQASAESEDNYNLLLGFGHVRVLVTTKQNNCQYTKRLVSGPLFEVPVDVYLGKDHSRHIQPKAHADIELNEEVMLAIQSTGKCNSKKIEKLHELAKTTKTSGMNPFNPSSFEHFLQVASSLQCGTKVRRATAFNVHDPPENLEEVVITDASCLFSRKKKNSIFSNDARSLAEAFREGKLGMTGPVKGLMAGPDCCPKTSVEHKSGGLVYAQPASERQRQIGDRLLVKGEVLVNVVGPPGTGKTHSITNIAARCVQQSDRCLE
mmetsp:Transcript_24324/g.46307  ORF Transcript_24324/g.46307 Transcript_24324/m.46307 type:complete len:315 (-) Transcript_24324:1471-2415(-)